jgi:hypothetical protein
MHSDKKTTQDAGLLNAPAARIIPRRLRFAALASVSLVSLTACVVPFDTGANAAAMALDEMDNLSYSMRNETAVLQVQIDSLNAKLRKTDSLLRWVANLTGNPIAEEINWASVMSTLPADTGAVKVPPPDTGRIRPRPDTTVPPGKIPPG